MSKTYEEINEKIKSGKVVVVTAEEMINIVEKKGPKEASKKIDIVTTGTFAPMCSSGAFLNFGHSKPATKISKTLLNNVPAYSGIAAVDTYIGATEPCINDPLNKVYPGEFNYGGGHVIADLIAGKKVYLKAESYGTDCYPNKEFKKKISLKNLTFAKLVNPRNGYQNYNCAINTSNKTIYTYMGVLKPKIGNANYCSAGQLSPLLNDPYFKTIGIGTRIFLGGGEGFVIGSGTQHNPFVERTKKGVPKAPAGTMFLTGDMKNMSPKWVKGLSLKGYGCSIAIGIGVPIPILNEEIALHTAISNAEIFTNIVDYSYNSKNKTGKNFGEISYEQLNSGQIEINGNKIPTAPLSSIKMAREIADILKKHIKNRDFFLTKPVLTLPNETKNKRKLNFG